VTGPNRCGKYRGSIENLDELLYVIRNEAGTIVEAGIEEFAEVERLTSRSLKVTLRGEDGTKPLVLMVEADAPIVLREYGHRTEGSKP